MLPAGSVSWWPHVLPFSVSEVSGEGAAVTGVLEQWRTAALGRARSSVTSSERFFFFPFVSAPLSHKVLNPLSSSCWRLHWGSFAALVISPQWGQQQRPLRGRDAHLPVLSAGRRLAGSLGLFAQDVAGPTPVVTEAGDVCSRQPLAFDEERRGRGWRVRATVATPHRITAATSHPVRASLLRFYFIWSYLDLFIFCCHGLTDFKIKDTA